MDHSSFRLAPLAARLRLALTPAAGIAAGLGASIGTAGILLRLSTRRQTVAPARAAASPAPPRVPADDGVTVVAVADPGVQTLEVVVREAGGGR